MNMAPIQAIRLWDELVRCFHGKNTYGGDTAEIYISTMMCGHSPHHARNPTGEWAREDQEIACQNIYAVCKEFCKIYNCRIELLEAPDHSLELLTSTVFGHRIHLRVAA